jgi:predicted nucleic acid-binding protein
MQTSQNVQLFIIVIKYVIIVFKFSKKKGEYINYVWYVDHINIYDWLQIILSKRMNTKYYQFIHA